MSSNEAVREEFGVPMHANFVTGLPYGKGKIGAERALQTPEEIDAFATALGENTLPLTITNTADCVDERRTIALGDGTDDPDVLENRIVAQMPGGLVLPVTKAAVAANLVIVRDAKDFKDAYLKMYELLTGLGFEDGGHKGCGASKLVEQSVAEEVEREALLATLPVLTTVDGNTATLLERNQRDKRQLLESGFFGSWSSEWHEGFLSEKVPHNFSILEVDPNDPVTNGHYSSGIYLLKSAGKGFAKNKFIKQTGKYAFADTVSAADELTNRIIAAVSGSDEERARFNLELGVDAPQVLNQLVITGHPVFAEAA